MAAIALATSAAATAAATPALAASDPGALQIHVLSARADLVSAGQALVSVDLPAGTDATQVHMFLNTADVSSQFAMRANGQYEALLTGLSLAHNGSNDLDAVAPGGSTSHATLVDHPNGGPLFTGPQLHPWVCQSTATDAQCNQPTTYAYQYKSSVTGQFSAYDPNNPPADLATTTTDNGTTVPYIVRVETGYQDRDQYSSAIIWDPKKDWKPWAPQPQFNHKLVIEHGASCGIDHQTGSAPSVLDDAALSRGFAVMSTALDNAGHNCSLETEAESLIMAKQRVVEEYGTLRYTIGTGCSGGSLVQQQVSNAYPGVYQGILPQCSFPDAWSTGQQLADYHLDRLYFENPQKWGTGIAWTPAQIAAVEGHPNHVNSIILDTLYWTATADPSNACAGVTAAQRWSQTNPGGVRCTLADVMINVFGTRNGSFSGPEATYAGRPIDNVGVEYGLRPLEQGLITPAQFVDLNASIGGADINSVPQPNRVAADEPALANGYRSGAFNETNNMRNVAIIDLRGTDPGAFHDVYRAFAIRARLLRHNGTSANQVIWQGTVPLLGDVNYTTQGLIAMDRWLSAVEADHSSNLLAQKLIADKPADIHDQCTDGAGVVIPSQQVCQLINPVFSTPRIQAGEDISTDDEKCRLKPLLRSEFMGAPFVAVTQFTDAEWAQLQATFPNGVCDFSVPGVDQQPSIPWMNYQNPDGTVITGGTPLLDAPAGSGGGWTAPSFSEWLTPKATP